MTAGLWGSFLLLHPIKLSNPILAKNPRFPQSPFPRCRAGPNPPKSGKSSSTSTETGSRGGGDGDSRRRRHKSPQKGSYGTSRRSVIKKSLAQEQVVFNAPPAQDPTVAIIGGGVSGLACASALEERGIRSTVFDTGKHGLGGRMATRMVDAESLVFDHAAQFFTVSDPRFQKLVDQWLEKMLVREWKGLVGELEVGGHFIPITSSIPRYIGARGMRFLADSFLCQSRMVTVVRPCWVSKLEPFNGMWHLSEKEETHGQFDAVVIAHNGKCANRLLSTSGLPLLTKQMKRLELSAVWALLAAFRPLPSPPFAMAGRSRAPVHPLHLRDPPPPSGLYGRPPPQAGLYGRPPPDVLPLRPHPLDPRDDPRRRLPVDPHAAILALEDRLAAQNREIQDLLIDNQRLAATHVALKQELTAAERDLHIIATDSAKARDEREAEVRAMYERAAKAEAEARGVEGMREELEHVREDLVKLRANRDELVERLRGMQKEHERAKLEVAQVPEIRAEIEAMHREIQRGRAAVEYEKNAHAGNMEQSQLMEANMVSLAREVEKLRAELANAEKRARATAAAAAAAANPGYNTGNSEMAYGGAGYADAYAMQQGGADSSGHYGSRGADGAPQYGSSAPPQYGSRAVDSASQYGSGGVSRGGPYDMQQTHAYR